MSEYTDHAEAYAAGDYPDPEPPVLEGALDCSRCEGQGCPACRFSGIAATSRRAARRRDLSRPFEAWPSCGYCEVCGCVQRSTPGGTSCENGHGGAGTLDEPPAAPLVVEISASQIGAWDTCQRKWAYTYVAGIRSPSNASAALGSAVHEKLERHMLRGEAFDLTPREDGAPTVDAIAVQALPFVPRTWLAVEAPFRLAVTPRGTVIGNGDEAAAIEGVTAMSRGTTTHVDGSELDVVILNGRIDVIRDAFTVLDWKTSKDVRRYAKTAEDLETDPAAIIYAAALETATARRTDAADKDGAERLPTSLEWVYLSTKLEGARPVRAAVRGVRSLPLLAPQLEGIVAARKAWKTPEDAPPNPAGCMAFGGCFFRDRCSINQTPQGPSTALGRRMIGASPMDLAALLAAANQAPPAQAAPVTPPTTPAAPTPTVDLAGMGIDLSKLGGAANAAGAAAAAQKAAERPTEADTSPRPATQTVAAPVKLSTGGEGATAGYVLYVDCYPVNRETLPGYEIVRQAAAALSVAGVVDWRAASYQEGRGALATQVKALLDAHNASPVPRKAILVDTSSEAERACLDLFLAGAANVVRGVAR